MGEHKCPKNDTRNEVWVYDDYAILTLLGNSDTGNFEHNERIRFCPYCGADLNGDECQMAHSDLFRAMLGKHDMPYEVQDFRTRKITYVEVAIGGEQFLAEFDERLDVTRKFTLVSAKQITAEDAFMVLREVMDE